MFQNIGVLQKMSDFDISETCSWGKKIHLYKHKIIFFINLYIGVNWVGAKKGGMPLQYFLSKSRFLVTELNRGK